MKPVQSQLPQFQITFIADQAPVLPRNSQEALLSAIYDGDIQRIETLCDSDSDLTLTSVDTNGNTPIHVSIAAEKNEITELLLQRLGPKDTHFLNSVDREGNTPLMLATQLRNVTLMAHLARLGCNTLPNGQINTQNELLMWKLSPALILLKSEGNISTAFELAVQYRAVDAANLFFDAGASTLPSLRESDSTRKWIAHQGLLRSKEVLIVLEEAIKENKLESIAPLTTPSIALQTIDFLEVRSDRKIFEALNTFIKAGTQPESLLTTLIERLTLRGWLEPLTSTTNEFDTLRLLVSMGTACDTEIIKLIKAGGFTNLWIVSCMIDYGADPIAALRELQTVSEHWGSNIARCAIEYTLRSPDLSDDEKITKLQKIIIEDPQNEGINVAIKILMRDGPLDNVKLLICAGIPHDEALLVALGDKARALNSEPIRVRAPLPTEQELMQQYVRQNISQAADFFSQAKRLLAGAENLSIRNGDIVEIQKCQSTAKIIIDTALQQLIKQTEISNAEKIKTLQTWAQDEIIKLGLSNILVDILYAGHYATAKLMIIAGVPATQAYLSLSHDLAQKTPASKAHTTYLAQLGADYQPAMQALIKKITALTDANHFVNAQKEQKALDQLSIYIAESLRDVH